MRVVLYLLPYILFLSSLSSSSLFSAEPLLRAEDVSISALESSFSLSFLLTTEDDIAAVTVVFSFEPEVVEIQEILLPENPRPEWSDYIISEDWVAFGWIMDFVPPYDGAVLPGGEDVYVGGLSCRLKGGTAPGSYLLHLPQEGRKAEGPLLRNSYATSEGTDDIFPELLDGTLTVTWPELIISDTSVTYDGDLATVTVRGEGFIPQTTLTIEGEGQQFQLVDSHTLIIPDYECEGEVSFQLCNGDYCIESSFNCGIFFVRGDSNADGYIDIADPILILGYLFSGTSVPCADAADVNDDGVIDIADPIRILGFLFAGSGPPPAPFPEPGPDPTEDALGCESYPGS